MLGFSESLESALMGGLFSSNQSISAWLYYIFVFFGIYSLGIGSKVHAMTLAPCPLGEVRFDNQCHPCPDNAYECKNFDYSCNPGYGSSSNNVSCTLCEPYALKSKPGKRPCGSRAIISLVDEQNGGNPQTSNANGAWSGEIKILVYGIPSLTSTMEIRVIDYDQASESDYYLCTVTNFVSGELGTITCNLPAGLNLAKSGYWIKLHDTNGPSSEITSNNPEISEIIKLSESETDVLLQFKGFILRGLEKVSIGPYWSSEPDAIVRDQDDPNGMVFNITVPKMVGTDLPVRLHRKGFLSMPHPMGVDGAKSRVSFDNPEFFSISETHVPLGFSEQISIEGSGFHFNVGGTPGTLVLVSREDGQEISLDASSYTFESSTKISFQLPHSSEINSNRYYQVLIRANGQEFDSHLKFYLFDDFRIESVSLVFDNHDSFSGDGQDPLMLKCTGHQQIYVTTKPMGDDLSSPHSKVDVKFKHSNGEENTCLDAHKISATKILCTVPPAMSPGSVNLVAVIDGKWESSGTFTAEYGPMTIVAALAANSSLRTRGFSTASNSEILYIYGENFGDCSGPNSNVSTNCHTVEAKVGGVACESSLLVRDGLIECEMPGGVGMNLNVILSSNNLQSNLIDAVNYSRPEIFSVYPKQLEWQAGQQIEIRAQEFGNDASALSVRLYENGESEYIECLDLNLDLSASRQIRCTLPQSYLATNNGRYYISLVAGNQESSKSNNPVIYGVYPSTDLDTVGGERLAVAGKNFQQASQVLIIPSALAAEAGETTKQCQSLEVDSSGTFLSCQTPAMVGHGHELAIITDADTSTGLRSINLTEISFRKPVIHELSENRWNEDPDQVIEITGKNFGSESTTQNVYVIFNSLNNHQKLRQIAELKSPTQINTQRHPEMNQGSYFLQVEVGGVKSGDMEKFRFINNNANTPPEHPDLSKSLDQDSSLIIQLKADDVDGDPLVFMIDQMPKMGRLYQYDSKSLTKGIEITQNSEQQQLPVVDDQDGFLMYTPNPSRHGQDEFIYYADDQKNRSLPIKVNLTVQMVNIAPKFTQDSLDIYVGETQFGVSLLGLGQIPLEDQDETQQLVLYASKLPSRGQWYIVEADNTVSTRIEFDASKEGGGLVVPAASVAAGSQQRLKIGYQHDGQGGGYPFDQFELRANDTNKAQTANTLTVNVIVRCDAGKVNNVWGAESGELCVDCPAGAICSDTGENFPVNKAGYYPVDNSTFLPCTPRDACPAGRSASEFQASQFGCADGYNGDRCAQCSFGYYRSGDECARCATTELDLRLIIPLVLLGLGFLLGAMILLRRIDLGFMSIMITYMQTISVFQQFRLEWPQQVIEMFRVFSVFNLNIDLAAPECFMGDQANGSYELKYFGTLALPLILSGAVILALIISRIVKFLRPHVLFVVQTLREKYFPKANQAESNISTENQQSSNLELPRAQSTLNTSTASVKVSKSTYITKEDSLQAKKAISTPSLAKSSSHHTLNLPPIKTPQKNRKSTGSWMASMASLSNFSKMVVDDLPPLESSEMANTDNTKSSSSSSPLETLDKLQSQPGLIASLAGAAVFAMKILYLSLARRSVELFQCVEDGNSGYMFVPEPGRKCFSSPDSSGTSWWWQLFPYSMAGIAIYILGIPMLSLYLSMRRMAIIGRYMDHANETKKQQTAATKWEVFILQITYKKRREFRLEYEYWDVMVMLRKLLLALCQLFFAQYPGFQAVVLLGVLLGAFLLHRNHQPYNARSLNFLESSTIISAILVLLSGLLFFNGVFYGQNIDVLGVLVIMIVCWSLLLVSWMLVTHFSKMLVKRPKLQGKQSEQSMVETSSSSSSSSTTSSSIVKATSVMAKHSVILEEEEDDDDEEWEMY